MKKIFIIIILLFILITPKNSLGQINSPVPTQTNENEDTTSSTDKIDIIKDKVTSKVAQLNLVEKRGIIGSVQEVNGFKITINDLNDKNRIIDVDELTKYSSSETDGFNLSEIKKGTNLSIIGLYNKDSEKLLARFVNEVNIPIFLSGVIFEKNDKDFTLNLATENKKNFTVNVEDITKSYAYTKDDLETTGFSKFKTMQNAIIVGFPDPKNKDEVTASKIIVFPEIPKNPRIIIEEDKSTEKISPTLTPTP